MVNKLPKLTLLDDLDAGQKLTVEIQGAILVLTVVTKDESKEVWLFGDSIVNLSTFLEKAMADPSMKCGYDQSGPLPGYKGCTRIVGHSGPCAHPYSGSSGEVPPVKGQTNENETDPH